MWSHAIFPSESNVALKKKSRKTGFLGYFALGNLVNSWDMGDQNVDLFHTSFKRFADSFTFPIR